MVVLLVFGLRVPMRPSAATLSTLRKRLELFQVGREGHRSEAVTVAPWQVAWGILCTGVSRPRRTGASRWDLVDLTLSTARTTNVTLLPHRTVPAAGGVCRLLGRTHVFGTHYPSACRTAVGAQTLSTVCLRKRLAIACRRPLLGRAHRCCSCRRWIYLALAHSLGPIVLPWISLKDRL